MNMEAPKPKRQTPLDAAIAYHALNLRVVLLHNLTVTRACSCKLGAQCLHAGKHPRLGGWNKPGAGMLETADDIRDAFSRYPRANVGVITGGPQYSSIICIDVDPKHDGNTSLEKLFAAHAPFPPTWQARTGSGGSHYLFKHPGPGWIVRNSQADDKKHHPKLGTGLDVKGDRGQFVAPPSAHASGKRYEWVNAPGGDVGLAELPEWLLGLIAEKEGEKKRKADKTDGNNTGDTSESPPKATKSAGKLSKKSQQAWAQAALKAELETLRTAPQGNRNNLLNNCSMNLFQIVANGLGLLDGDVVIKLLYDAAQHAWGDEFEPSKVRATIESGKKKGLSTPRLPPAKEGTKYTSPSATTENDAMQTSQTQPNQPLQHVSQPKPSPQPDELDLVDYNFDSPQKLATDIIDNRYSYEGCQTIYHWNEMWWLWDSKTKHYRIVPIHDLRPKVTQFISQEFHKEAEAIAEETGKRQSPKDVTREIVSNVIANMEAKCNLSIGIYQSQPMWIGAVHPGNGGNYSLSRDQIDHSNWISMKNGLLSVAAVVGGATGLDECMTKPTPLWFSRTCLPYDFDPDAECPLFIKSINLALENDEQRIALLQEFFGYILARGDLSKQKFLVLIGDGNNGKGGVISAMLDMLGSSNYSSVSLDQFGTEFGLVPAMGMLANIYTEVSELDKVAEAKIKQYTAGEPMEQNIKYKNAVNTIPTAKLVFSTNEAPHFTDKSDGIWRRLIAIPFRYKIKASERIDNMASKGFWVKRGEVQGIFKWALAGLIRLNKEGWTQSDLVDAKITEMRNHSQNTRMFLIDAVESDSSNECGGVGASELYQQYKKWCEENGYERARQGRVNFGKEVERMFNAKYSVDPVWVPRLAKSVRAFVGIKHKNEVENET